MKVKLTLPDAKPPYRVNPDDAGADLISPKTVHIYPHTSEFIDLGVQIELPENTVGYIFARSGLGTKFGIRPRNCVGVIDQKYRGNLRIMVENASEEMYVIFKGDRIAQLVIQPVYTPEFEVVDKLDETDRGEGGFGSSGK